ncbi:MAG: dipicolinate synthase subunit DpsA [Armatimonadota bacterium]|nr:dipicolinate synthase subunit DpsA [Armatimonadota bacterium]MDR7448940.1 dipicolinate synthase subunit DpsA [Armatimonadota bacterium]MDR7460430.1 dipicolinate synthase subunit DpsA [Armatimonadota bacterium]MDR7480555.1 dipicolinate synthase subunit DpsA [Armatimonadota bacterium]MDR7489261.1 dipicolinate synthase subunit DpsA [Armatimonadota bacterium]
MSGELAGWVVAVLGGDRRMLEHMRQARAAGATVQHYGAAPGAEEAAGAPEAPSLAAAVRGARLISCPIPGLGTDHSLYAPFAREKLFLTTEVLRGAAPGALMFMGRVSPQIAAWAEGTPVTPIGYGDDDPLAIMHAVPTAEGALKEAITHTEETILGLPTLCIGMGRVGMSVARAFRALEAQVTLAARNPSQLARAWAMGLATVHLRELPQVIERFPLIVSSASGLVLTGDLLARTRPDVVIIDLCSPPGSVDFAAAADLGRKVIWARGQAGTAPRTSGYNEWQVIMRLLRERVPDLRRS